MPYADPEKNREYHNRKSREWCQNNREKARKKSLRFMSSAAGRLVKRRSVLKSIFWTLEKYEKALVAQKLKCAICGSRFNLKNKRGKGAVCADHDHKKKVPRELLCSACNFVLGQAQDSIRVLENAIEYLRKHNSDAKKKSSRG